MYVTFNQQNKSHEITYKIEKRLGVIGTRGDDSKELNLVSYNGAAPKYDLRTWRREDGQERLLKGLTMNAEELQKLKDLLNGIEI